MKRTRLIVSVLVVLVSAAAGALAALWRAGHEHQLELRHDATTGFYWTCSMHPQVRRDAAGGCPICGMQLIQRRATAAASTTARQAEVASSGLVQIEPRMLQNLGVRTAPVQLRRLSRRVTASGRIALDERSITVLGSRSTGWVEKLHVRAAGEPVRQGQLLAEIFGPELVRAQDAHLAALEVGSNQELIEGTREDLLRLGVQAAQIAEIERTRRSQRRIRLHSPIDGYLLELSAAEGAQIMPEMPLFKLGSLRRVWAVADIPESQAAWVRPGAAVEVQTAGMPGRVFRGSIDHIYPQLDTRSGTLQGRVVLDNPERLLKPGMSATLSVLGETNQSVLCIPSEAVIRTGKRQTVLLAEGAGRFRPVAVRTGLDSGTQVAILSGLAAGQHVVTSGQFLIDSEASLQGAYERLSQGPAEDATGGDAAPTDAAESAQAAVRFGTRAQ